MLLSLEKMRSSLLGCRAALLHYAEGQRSRCPWFYLLPLHDILHFVCYGGWVSATVGVCLLWWVCVCYDVCVCMCVCVGVCVGRCLLR